MNKTIEFPEANIICSGCRKSMKECRLLCLSCSDKSYWINVKNYLPSVSQYYLVRKKDNYWPKIYYYSISANLPNKKGWKNSSNSNTFLNETKITHWMFLPDPPKSDNQEKVEGQICMSKDLFGIDAL